MSKTTKLALLSMLNLIDLLDEENEVPKASVEKLKTEAYSALRFIEERRDGEPSHAPETAPETPVKTAENNEIDDVEVTHEEVEEETAEPSENREKQPSDMPERPANGANFFSALEVLNEIHKQHSVKTEEEQEFEEAVEETNDADEAEDIISVKKSDLSLHYLAFSVKTADGETGNYELITSPLDSAHQTGKFMFWVNRYNSNHPFSGVSEEDRGQEKVKYQLPGKDMFITISQRKDATEHDLNVFIPEKFGTVTIVRKSSLGTGTHILLHDGRMTIHVLPTDVSEDGSLANHFLIVEKDGKYEPFISSDGYSLVEVNGERFEISLKWEDDTVYSRVERV